MLTSRPPQLSSIADVVSQDTQDLLVTSPLRHTKPVAHALTQKTCIANQNEICPKPALEDTGDSSISSTQGSYLHDHATHPMKYSLIDLTNLTLNCGKNPSQRLLQIFVMNLLLFFHNPFSCQTYLLFFKRHQEIPHGLRMSPNRTFLYAAKIQYKKPSSMAATTHTND
jgi:hypothetical protein